MPVPVCNGWFVKSGRTTIELKESNKFHDAVGNVLFRIHATRMTLSGRIIVRDARGAEIGHVRRKYRTMCLFAGCSRTTHYFGYKNNGVVGAVKASTTRPDECDADIYLGNTWIGKTTGSWFEKSVSIDIGGYRVAEILRRADAVEGGFGIEILEAGVDASLILMIVVALGEIYGWADSFNGGVSSRILSESAGMSYSDRSPTSDSSRESIFLPRYRGILG